MVDYEAQPYYHICVNVNDSVGYVAEESFVIVALDENEVPMREDSDIVHGEATTDGEIGDVHRSKRKSKKRQAPPGELLLASSCPSENSNRLETEREKRESCPIEVLKSARMQCYQMSWQQYQNTVATDDQCFDLILTDPPYCLKPNASRTGKNYSDYIHDREMKSFAQFCRRMIKPGGHVVIFSSFLLMSRWFEAFGSTDMTIMSHPLTIIKDSSGLQRTRNVSFPQNAVEYALVVRAAGRHPNGFSVDLESQYCLLRPSHHRKFNVIDRVPIVRNKLTYPGTRSIVRVEEKNPFLLSEIMTTFAPEDGMILDPYAGTMTTGISCLATKRPCTLIEPTPDCFRLARERLVGLASKSIEFHKKRRVTRSSGESDISVVETRSLLSTFDSTNINDSYKSCLEKDDCPGAEETNLSLQEPSLKAEKCDSEIQIVCAAGPLCILSRDRAAQRLDKMLSRCTVCAKNVHDLCGGGECSEVVCKLCKDRSGSN